LGDRQYACSQPECQEARQRGNVAAWRARHPAYRVEHAIRLRELRAAKEQQVVDPLEVPPPLSGLPWDVAQKSFGIQGTDFLAHLARLLLVTSKKSMPAQVLETTAETGRLPRVTGEKSIPGPAESGP
jgi:hypothetical protein